MWLLLVKNKGRYEVHSVHQNEVAVREWCKCKDRDGVDSEVAYIGVEEMDEFIEQLEIYKKG